MAVLSKEYWESRALETEAVLQRDATKTVREVAKAYDDALRSITSDMDRIITKYTKEGKLSPTDARRMLNTVESNETLDKLMKQAKSIKDPELRRVIVSRLNAPAVRARLTRLQALKESVYIQCKKAAEVELRATKDHYITTMNESYLRSIYALQTGTGLGFAFNVLPQKAIEEALKSKWSGKNYSEAVWKNTDRLADKAQKIITSGLMSGRTNRQMAQELEKWFKSAKYASVRLVRTETNYYMNQGTLQSYKEVGVKNYIYLATLDSRTSEQCQDMDGQVIPVESAKAGRNYPPLHPHCRSTTIEEFGDEDYARLKRRAKDPATGQYYEVPRNMTYKQWKGSLNAQQVAAYNTSRKMRFNMSSDLKQYEMYKERLGADNVPNRFADFQKMKYTDKEQWDTLKENYSTWIYRQNYEAIAGLKGSLSDYQARRWYKLHVEQIPSVIDTSGTLEQQAFEAYSLRNKYRFQARELMSDQKSREELDHNDPNLTFEELISDKMIRKGISRTEAMQDIIRTAPKTNRKVNAKLGLE